MLLDVAGDDRSKEREGSSNPPGQSSIPEASRVPKTEGLMMTREAVVATLAMNDRLTEEKMVDKIRGWSPDATDEDIKSILGEVMAKRKELW